MKILILFGLLAVAFGLRSPYFSYQPEVLRQGFYAVDLDHNGILTRDELLIRLRKQDANGDGFLSYEEFKLSQPMKTPLRIVKGQFQYYDKLDGASDGRYSFSGADRMINILDTNKDGVVTVYEFVQNIPHVLDDMTKEIDALVVVG